MAYYVRLFTPSDKVVPFSEMEEVVKVLRLTRGMDNSWEQIEIHNLVDTLLAILERHPVTTGSSGETELASLKDRIRGSYPVNAREWIKNYLDRVKTIYAFQLLPDSIISREDWQTLGRVQNLLKDALTGIIQADNEGFYNENGDYILWQMYPGASGSIPAATLDETGEWVQFQLKLNDDRVVERFKQGEMPKRGFFDLLFRK